MPRTSFRRPTTSRTRSPRLISFKTGGLLTGLLGIAIQPWKLLADPSGYIFTWLLGYSGGLGSIAGVLIADYWIVRRRELQLEDLYLDRRRLPRVELAGYRRHGHRLRAGVGRAVVPALKPLYDYAWFVGFFAAGLTRIVLGSADKTDTAEAAPASARRRP